MVCAYCWVTIIPGVQCTANNEFFYEGVFLIQLTHDPSHVATIMASTTELDVQDLVASISFEINNLSSNYPDVHTAPLIRKITDLLNIVDSKQKLIDLKDNDLDSSHLEIAVLLARLEIKRNHQKRELDHRLTDEDAVEEAEDKSSDGGVSMVSEEKGSTFEYFTNTSFTVYRDISNL
ncbi:hypothetical protein J6590_104492 [Homalodisca vitripennis]|nr:hypothetical protein J6590_104492 [Homalodisca vitripennis]